MAYYDLIAALTLPAHPLARSGFGKRSVAAQEPGPQQDFAHLPMREGCIAAYIDRLPEGSAIDTKSLARALPLWGQQAVRSALRRLSEAGHLRRVRKTTVGSNGSHQWVQRTYFSAVARDDSWWAAHLADVTGQQSPLATAVPVESEPEVEEFVEGPEEEAEEEKGEEATAAEREPTSDAYRALTALSGAEPRLTLSAAECSALEGLAAEWFARGASLQQFTLTLTAGLPQVVHNAGALTRTRLIQKMPPKPSASPVRERTLECTDCRRPGPIAALPGGLCADCRNDTARSAHGRPLADDLRLRVAGLRNALRASALLTG